VACKEERVFVNAFRRLTRVLPHLGRSLVSAHVHQDVALLRQNALTHFRSASMPRATTQGEGLVDGGQGRLRLTPLKVNVRELVKSGRSGLEAVGSA